MDISFDNANHFDAGYGGNYSTTITVSPGAYIFVLTKIASSPTLDGQSPILLLDFSSSISDGNGQRVVVYGFPNVSGGTKTLAVTNTGTTYNVVWASYLGVDEGVQPEASTQVFSNNGINNTQVVSMQDTVTTITDKAWTILFSSGGNNINPMTAGIGTLRATAAGTITANTVSIIDSNGPVSPPGNSTLQANFTNGLGGSGTGFISCSIFSVKPQSSFTPQMTII